MFDVVIIGAGPAGATAAAMLAARRRRVALVDRRAGGASGVRGVWVNPRTEPILGELGLEAKATLGAPFSEVAFYDAQLSKSAVPAPGGVVGYLVEQSSFERALISAAVAAGAELHDAWEVADLRLGETDVELKSADDRTVRGRVLLAAMGPDSPLMHRVLPAERPQSSGRWIAQVQQQLDQARREPARVCVVLGLDRQGALGVAIVGSSRVTVSVSVPGTPDSVGDLLAVLCQRLANKEVVPVDLSAAAVNATVRHSPAGVALDMDSHVGKHALVTGAAGGFVAAASDEGIYPAMWSAQIAVEVVDQALGSRHSQDMLMEFDSKWRMAMAEYLRPANTDAQFLIPLIFSNQPMADRMAAAFFNGENI